MAAALSMLDSNMQVDKLTSDIFSILENKFLFGDMKSATGKVRILSIDGGDPLLAAAALSHLESSLRRRSSEPSAAVSDFFDIAAGSGSGGLLAALLFTRRPDGRPLLSAADALQFLIENRRRISAPTAEGLFRRRPKAANLLGKAFGEATLKDTCKAVLIPCYDLTSGAPFVFSRADALEIDSCDFKMRDVCGATLAGRAVEMRSVDKRTKISAVGGEVVMNNPTAAAITHVLNNKNEFPFCNGVEDLLVMSLGNGESGVCNGSVTSLTKGRGLVKIAGEGASDLVDQGVSMAFGESRANNYVRIQSNRAMGKINKDDLLGAAEEMLAQKNVESVLFQGKKVKNITNLEKLQKFAGELINEQERRKTSILPTVVLKHGSPSPRTSSATTLSSFSSN